MQGLDMLNDRSDKKIILWLALATGGILLIPLIAMQFTDEVQWGVFDFIVMGALLFGTGSLLILTARRLSGKRRILAGLAVLILFLYIWAELAVGIFTDLGS
jgi:peptidoglycan/LPS O-acetylase OafA/YrhL